VKVLIKPVSPVFYYATVGIAQRLKDFLSLSPIIILIMLSIGLPSSFSFAVILKIALAAFVALVIDHTLMGTIGLVAFWTTQIIWLSNFIRQIFNLISGARFPVNFFPIILVTFLSFTPLYFLAYFPAAIFLGKLGDSIGREFIIGIFWTVALTTLYLALWKRGLKRYEGSSQ
jgi:ABC-2 type transport system permease protein